MTRVALQTINAVELGAKQEVQLDAMVTALYSPLNKLTHVEFTFDVISVMQQLRRASGQFDFHVRAHESFFSLNHSFINDSPGHSKYYSNSSRDVSRGANSC